MAVPARQSAPTDPFHPDALRLLNRHSPGAFTATFGADAARQFAPMPLRVAAETIANGAGLSVTAAMATDDFQTLLGDLVHVAGIAGYASAPPAILAVSHETNDISNFKPVTRVRGSGFPALEQVPEGAEVRYGGIGEESETYAALRYSKLLELTEAAVVNDDLGMLVGPALRVGEAVADCKAGVLADRIAGNPAMSDGNAVFSDAHGNLAATGSELSVASLSAARLSMRRQKAVGGERPASVEPAFLIVPPELETAAEQLVASIQATATGEVNPFASRLTVICEPRLIDPTAWYLFARPERRMGLEHGRVEGTADPEVRTEPRLERHAIVTRVSIAFGCGWVDWRGAYRNPGA